MLIRTSWPAGWPRRKSRFTLVTSNPWILPLNDMPPRLLSDEERDVYQWQLWVDGFGEPGQEQLKGASVLVSRVGGLGGVVAYQLAAAGVGRLVLAHAGNVRPNDLN